MGLTDIPLIGGIFEGIPLLDGRSKFEKVIDKIFSIKVLIGLGLTFILLSKAGVVE